MTRPQLRAEVRPPLRPRAARRYRLSPLHGYTVEIPADDSSCKTAAPAAPPVAPPLPIVRLTFAAIVTANAIAFAADPVGSWATLRAAVLHLLGAR